VVPLGPRTRKAGSIPAMGDAKNDLRTIAFMTASEVYDVTVDDLELKVAGECLRLVGGPRPQTARTAAFRGERTREGSRSWMTDEGVRSEADRRLGTYSGFKSMTPTSISLGRGPSSPRSRDSSSASALGSSTPWSGYGSRPSGALNLLPDAGWQATPAQDAVGHDIETLLLARRRGHGDADDQRNGHGLRLVDHAMDGAGTASTAGSTQGAGFAGRGSTDKDWWTRRRLNALC